MQERLKMLRASMGLTQKAIAERLDISAVAWQKYELGQAIPGGEVLQKIAMQGINVNWLLTGAGEMSQNNEPVYNQDLYDIIFQLTDLKFQQNGLVLESSKKVKLLKLLYKHIKDKNFVATDLKDINNIVSEYVEVH